MGGIWAGGVAVWVTMGAAGAVMGGGVITGPVGILLTLPPRGMVAVWVASLSPITGGGGAVGGLWGGIGGGETRGGGGELTTVSTSCIRLGGGGGAVAGRGGGGGGAGREPLGGGGGGGTGGRDGLAMGDVPVESAPT